MIIRGNFGDFFFETALPALNAISWQSFQQKPQLFRKLFKVETSNRSIEQNSQMSGVGLFHEIPETGEVRQDAPVQGYDSLFTHKRFGLSVEYSRDLFEDDKVGIIKQMPVELGLSANETMEIDGASTFNNAFSTNGPDGVPLCSASHPLIKAGGVQSNILTVAAELDHTSLELALIQWATMKRSNGHHMNLPAPRLLIAPKNHFNAHEILKSTMRSDTANNATNALKFAENGPVSDILTWAKLTAPKAWFLVAPPAQTGLVWYWRVKLYSGGFRDDRNERAGIAKRYKKSHGWHDYVGVFGTPGE